MSIPIEEIRPGWYFVKSKDGEEIWIAKIEDGGVWRITSERTPIDPETDFIQRVEPPNEKI